MALEIVIFYGSVRTARQGIKAAKFVAETCRKRGHGVTLLDAKEENLPLLDRMYKEYPRGEAPANLERIAGLLRRADAFVVVSGEYNHSIPPALSNMMDFFLEEYAWRPSGIVCYSAGAFGGVRAAMQLRAFLGEVGAPSIPSIYAIPQVQDAFDDDGNARGEEHPRRIVRFLSELEWYANALARARESGVPY
jgi:NAD(P)H-dependent FMN reductase